MDTIKIQINGAFIRLDALLKLSGVAATGGQAKVMIQNGEVLVNGSTCVQRGKKIIAGDKVAALGTTIEAS